VASAVNERPTSIASGLAGELVDDVEKAQLDPLIGGVVLEVQRPDVAGVGGLGRSLGARVARPAPLGRLGRHPQALLAPDPLHPLAVDRPAQGEQVAVGTAIAPALVVGGDLAQLAPQGLVI